MPFISIIVNSTFLLLPCIPTYLLYISNAYIVLSFCIHYLFILLFLFFWLSRVTIKTERSCEGGKVETTKKPFLFQVHIKNWKDIKKKYANIVQFWKLVNLFNFDFCKSTQDSGRESGLESRLPFRYAFRLAKYKRLTLFKSVQCMESLKLGWMVRW